MPFTGSSIDDMERLRFLAKQYVKQVPFGIDFPLDFWAQEIYFHSGDMASRLWLEDYSDRFLGASNTTRH